jgi:NitT/TauT family transport system substrate-binding protein
MRWLALLAGLVALVSAGSVRAENPKPQIAAQLSFDRPLEASMAPFVVAASRGLFAAENLAISFHVAAGSAEAIERVASGDSEFALVDVNELVRFRDKADARRSRRSSSISIRRPMPSSRARAAASTRSPISPARRSGSPKAI